MAEQRVSEKEVIKRLRGATMWKDSGGTRTMAGSWLENVLLDLQDARAENAALKARVAELEDIKRASNLALAVQKKRIAELEVRKTIAGGSDKKKSEFTAVWLRRLGDKAQVLVEVNDVWFLAVEETYDGNFSHIAEVNGAEYWPIDIVTEDKT